MEKRDLRNGDEMERDAAQLERDAALPTVADAPSPGAGMTLLAIMAHYGHAIPQPDRRRLPLHRTAGGGFP